MASQNKDDLNFIPLNITGPLKPGSSKFPLVMNMDGISIGTNSNNIFLNFSAVTPSPMISNFKTNSPLTPYPSSIPELEYDNSLVDSETIEDILNEELIPQSELSEDDLYSYNESNFDNDYFKNTVDHMELLRVSGISIDDFDSYDRGKKCDNHIDDIFKDIEENHKGIIAAMRTYRIPYPITKLLIKKIIEISLRHS